MRWSPIRAAAGTACVLLAACSSSGDSTERPDSAEMLRRAQIVGPALTGRPMEATESDVAGLTCIVDNAELVDDPAYRAGFEGSELAVMVAADLVACAESEYDEIAPLNATLMGIPLDDVEALVDTGRQALD